MLKKCLWCGRDFEAKTRRALFCSARCRVAHHRAVKDGLRLSPNGVPLDEEPSRSPLTDDDIARAVLQARGSAAMLDAASARGPVDKRELCRFLSESINGALRKVGL